MSSALRIAYQLDPGVEAGDAHGAIYVLSSDGQTPDSLRRAALRHFERNAVLGCGRSDIAFVVSTFRREDFRRCLQSRSSWEWLD